MDLEVPDARLPRHPGPAGYAHDLHAVYVVCDGTCAKTFPPLSFDQSRVANRPEAGATVSSWTHASESILRDSTRGGISSD